MALFKVNPSFRRTAMVLLMQTSLLTPLMAPLAAAPAFAATDATAALLAKDSPERTPGQKPDPKSLEGGIWAETAKAERQARTSGERNHDPELQAYVDSVIGKVSGPFASDIRLYVMDRPFFNAQVAPNGYAEVWSGLMLRCQTEDELAFVLGHEAGHFRHSHSLKRYQEMKNGANAALAATLLIAFAGAAAQANAGSYQAMQDIGNITRGLIDITYLGIIAAVMSYSRDSEEQADAYGLIYAREAGYFTRAGESIWRAQIEETAASDYERTRKAQAHSNIFGSHPLNAERLVDLAAQDKAANGGVASTRTDEQAKAARAAYRGHVRPYLAGWLKDDLRRQDYGQTIHLANRLLIDNDDAGVLNFYKGEAYRLRGKNDDLDQALGAYRTALGFADAPKETYRQIGDIHRRLGDPAKAMEAFELYIAAAPEAEDAWMVQDQIDTIKKSLPAPPAESVAPNTTTPETTAPATEPDTRGL